MNKRIAIILFNLGGPDDLRAVKPFLFNLFNDYSIISLPQPMRFLLAKFIFTMRNKKAQAIYKKMGNKSSILEETEQQAAHLESYLNELDNENEYKVFIIMRYWDPRAVDVIQEVEQYTPDEITLLPLYPQFSGTTTGSSFKEWDIYAKKYGIASIPTHRICCYPMEAGFIGAYAAMIADCYVRAMEYNAKLRILFSAHGLPMKQILAGDPYDLQILESVKRIINSLEQFAPLDWRVCYQSKVGPLKWLSPSTESEIINAGVEGLSVVVVPIAFVSEHSETKVELDIEYRELAEKHGVKGYFRVPTVSSHPLFIAGLAKMCFNAGVPVNEEYICPIDRKMCCRKHY